jgi:hypothetical protein
LAFYFFIEWLKNRDNKIFNAIIILSFGIGLAIIQVIPPEDLMFSDVRKFKFNYNIEYITVSIITGISSLSVIIYFAFIIQVFRSLANHMLQAGFLITQSALFMLFVVIFYGSSRHHVFLLFSAILYLWLNNSNHKSNKIIHLFLSAIFIMLLTSGIAYSYNEWKYSFSNAKDAAIYLKSKISKEKKVFIAAFKDDRGSALLPYLIETKFYYPNSDRWGTYIIWNTDRYKTNFNPRILNNILALKEKHPGFTSYYYLSNKTLQQDSISHYGITLEANFTDHYNSSFMREDEIYYLYKLSQ